ncbi:MAG TPA: adenylate/guanylate cyclase domain-containing protein [Sulfuriferula sp.]|nr:adenylate/guanylate cyclase domain-containing protein [Sulfuriferula sp.]
MQTARFKRALPRTIVSLLITLLLVLASQGSVRLGLLERLEAWSYDARLLLTMPHTVDPRVVIVNIDEKSLKEVGHWPWGRDKLAELVQRLFDHYSVASVGFDVVFAEPDTSSGLPALEKLAATRLKGNPGFASVLKDARPLLDFDGQFAESLRTGPVVLGYYFTPYAGTSGVLPKPVFAPGAMAGQDAGFIDNRGYGANLPALQANAAGGGFFNMLADFDGVTRRMSMLQKYQGADYEALSLATLVTTFGSTLSYRRVTDAGPHYTHLELVADGLRVPLDSQGAAYVPYRAYPGYRYYSAADILAQRIPADELENAIVLVGTTAPGLFDLRVTPVARSYPGVEIHANLISGILDDTIRYTPAYAHDLTLAVLSVLGVLLALILPRLTPVRGAALSLTLAALVVAGNYWAWQHKLVLPLAVPLVLILGLMLLNMAWGFFAETRAKRQITGLFGQYVPPELVDEMSQDPSRFNMRSESKELSILFSDVRGFTTISESLTPQQLSDLLNEFLSAMTQVIHHRQGTIDKYMGDCIMAFWGAPIDNPHHARDAVLAGMEMQAALTELNKTFVAKGWPELHVGVGINTGRVSVGNMGSQFRMAYTVMGDVVNLASRLEGITKFYAAPVAVGEGTRAALPEMVFIELDLVRVKGKEQPVAIFQPLGLQGQVDAASLAAAQRFASALVAYRAQRWDEAEAILNALQNEHPSKLYALYIERLTHLRDNPPGADWDGVWIYESK